MTLVACMCNQPDRLAEALAPLPLALPSPIGRWGLASVHGGEVLIARTPRPADGPLDLATAIADQRSDCVIAQILDDDRGPPRSLPLGGEDLPPFRFRRWMLAADPTAAMDARTFEQMIARVPEFLRRNLRGRSVGELTLHTLIALLYEQGLTDDAGLAMPALARITVEAIALVTDGLRRAAPAATDVSFANLAVSNSRALAVAAIAAPLSVYPLRVFTERGAHDPSFRGVLVASGLPAPIRKPDLSEPMPEHVPVGSLVTVTRDLQVAISPLAPQRASL